MSTTTLAREQPTHDDQVVERREAARAFALEALAKIDAGRFSEGIALLERAEASFHAPTHLLYLAQAHAALGHVGLAAQTYDALVREQLPDYAPDEFREAERMAQVELEAVQARVGRIELVLLGTGSAPVSVKVDGSPRRVAATLVYVDPGTHDIEVTVAGQVRTSKVTVMAGQLETLTLELGATSPEPRRSPVGPATEGGASASPYLVPGVVVLALGGVALAVGTLTGVLSFQDVDQLSDRCPSRVGCDPTDRALADSARVLGNVSTAMFVIGGAAAVTGIVLLLLPAPRPASPTAALFVGPASLGLTGSF